MPQGARGNAERAHDTPLIPEADIETSQRHGVVLLCGPMADHADLMRAGVEARHVAGPGRTSPPCPGHGMQPGLQLREDWFPVTFHR